MPKKRRNKTIKNYELKIKNEGGQVAILKQTNDKLVSKKVKKVQKLSALGGSALGREVKNLTAIKVEKFKPKSQPPKVEIEDEKTAEQKKLYMYIGVGGLMAVIFTVWIFTLKYEFRASVRKSARNEFNWEETRVELDKTMTQVKQGLAEIKKIQAASDQKATSSEPILTEEQIDLLKGKLLNTAEAETGSSSRK